MKIQSEGRRNGGFALIITLSLMVLLTLIVVGLLSLSSVSLRGSANGLAMATARSNARLALILALGELQRSAGPDQRVTARADIIEGKSANPQLTGVWESMEIKATAPPTAADYNKAAKDKKFKAWLVSCPDPTDSRQAAFAAEAATSPVTLWGKGTLGDKAVGSGSVNATKVPLNATQKTPSAGAMAWAVLDEGIKARVNTPYIDGATTASAKTVQLGAGERPGVEFIDGLTGLERRLFLKDKASFTTIEKGVSRLNYGLAAKALGDTTREAMQGLTHDITTHSLGLFTDVAHGGFKQDFQLFTNSKSVPEGFSGKGVYASLLNMPASQTSNPSDPTWASMHEYATLYRSDKLLTSGGVPYISLQAPSAAATISGTNVTVNRAPPTGVVLLPTIAKVQMLISLIGRDLYGGLPDIVGNRALTSTEKAVGIHGPQEGQFRNTRFDYDLHVLYSPIVTLHNPYDVALEFKEMRVEFVHLPFALQIFRNDIPQSTGLVPLETMYADNESGNLNKTFGMNLKTKVNDAPGSTTFKLMPGEVKIFTAYIDPNRTYAQDLGGRKFWDIYVGTGITTNIDAIPGWRGDGIGFDCDWVAGGIPSSTAADDGHWASCLGLAWDDKIHVLFAPLSTSYSNNKFVIQMSATVGSGSKCVSAIEMDYEKPTGLEDFMKNNGITTMPIRYPKITAVPNYIPGIELVDRSTKAIKDLTHVKPFALISAQAKNTSGGRDVSMEDGHLATKPWCFAHANIAASSQKIVSEHSANFSHEIDLQLLERGTNNLVQLGAQDRSNFISGNTGHGTKFGLQYEIPLAPLQTLASLNGANPGGSSGYLPRFAQPIGNSWAHPLISSGKLSESASKSGYTYLDHSFLLNLALYDNFYFSGLADQTGKFGTGKTTTTLASDFAAGNPLDDPRLLLHLPDSRPASGLATDVIKTDAYSRIAAWQLMQGPFNINSTSVLAWKAMLASIHDSQAIYNQLNKTNSSSAFTALTMPTTGKKSRISRFRLPASTSAEDGADLKDGYWLGPREYSDQQLQSLAQSIVNQVRLRGPFLSMAEFVNRRLSNDETAQRGALQQAIDDSGLNKGIAAAADAGFEITTAQVSTYKYLNPSAGSGSSYQGAPGYLTQADLLNVLGNAATPRSDTFTIRGYGEARDSSGKITAHATCEAVVQRFPEWVDPTDPVETAQAKLQSQANKTFGRRFLITSLRWLNPGEI